MQRDLWWRRTPALGKPPFTKTDEFSDKFQTTFDPPPPPISAKFCRFFGTRWRLCFLAPFYCQIYPQCKGKFAIQIFGSDMTPPPSFWNFSANPSVLVKECFPQLDHTLASEQSPASPCNYRLYRYLHFYYCELWSRNSNMIFVILLTPATTLA